MKIAGSFAIIAAKQQVWDLFMDPRQLAGCVPGCDNIAVVSPTRYEADMTIKVQFMTIKFKASGELKEATPGEQIDVEMTGQPIALAGLFRSRLTVRLSDIEGSKTLVNYDMDLQMTGRLASLGEILMRGTIQKSAEEFAANVQSLFSVTKQ